MNTWFLRQEDNANYDDGGNNRRRQRTAKSQSALIEGFIKEVSYSGAKRPGQDESHPEQKDT